MKRKLLFLGIILSICALFSAPFTALTLADATRWNIQAKPTEAWLSGSVGDPAWNWMKAIDQLVELGGTPGTGSIFYVDSGVTNEGDGTTWDNAKDTLDEAIALCENNRGDFIFVAPGHTETFSVAGATDQDSVDVDIAGVTIIGLGNGDDAPEFNWADVDNEFVIGAANVTIFNLRFITGLTSVTMGISIEDAGDYATIAGCVWPKPTTNTWEFLDAIDVASGVTNLKVIGCNYQNDDAGAAPAHFIDLGNAALVGIHIEGNVIFGDFSVSAIWSNDADTEVYIANNTITNMTADQHCIEFTGNATGDCHGNRMFTSAEATTLDPGYLKCYENYVTTAVDKSGMIIPVHDTGTTQLNAASVSAIATAVDALDGIGMVGLVETNVAGTTEVISAALGGYGDNAFIEGWSLVCIYDTGGAVGTAPSGEIRDVTAYTSTGGDFTTAAWTAALTAGDYVLLIPTMMIPDHYGKIGSKTIYCDDGGSGGEATNWQNAVTTLKAAELLAAVGDTILIGESHNENIDAAETINIAGVTVIGMGEGDTRPLLDYDSAATELTLDAAGVTIKNLRFRPSATVVVAGVVVGASGLGCTIDNCTWEVGEQAGDEFIDCISVNAAAEGLTVKNCTAWNTNATAGDSDTWLNLDAVTVDDCTVADNVVFGTFDEACIWWGAAVPVNLLIRDNVLSNLTTGQACIEGTGAATGMCLGNSLNGDTLGAILDPGSMRCYGNTQTLAIDEGGSPVPDVPQKVDSIHGTGQVFYVDASGSNGGGRTWATAKTTIDAAVNLCTADRGDFIYVAQGHSESFTSEQLDIDQGGITIIGIGTGSLMPTIVFGHADAAISVDADNITIRNIRCVATVAVVKIAITVKLNADYCNIDGCVFVDAGDNVGTDEFLDAINLVDTNIGCVIENCLFTAKAAGAETAIMIDDTSDQTIIRNNVIRGDYSVGCLVADTAASTNLYVYDNIIVNGSLVADSGLNAVEAINFMQDTAGLIARNLIASDVATGLLMRIGDDMCFMNNYITDDDGDEFDGGEANTSATIGGHTDG